MRSLFLCIFLVLFVLVGSAPAAAREPGWGRVYTVAGKVAVRENPAENALQVRLLKPGQKVRVDFEDDGWAAVFDPGETVRSETRAQGYVRLAELRSGGRAEPAAAPRAGNPGTPAKGGRKDAQKDAQKDVKKAPEPKVFGELRVADRQMAVRAGRDKDTEFKHLLKAGQRVRVDFLADGWYAVFDPDEKVRDLSKAWGYGRDKFLVPEKAYADQPLPEPAPAAKEALAKPMAATPAPKQKSGSPDSEAVGYTVLERQADPQRPLAPVVLRVRIEAQTPPAAEALRKIVREIWKAERRKGEDLQVEVLLPGQDQGGLAYAVARFHDDGRLKEFWWRDVVLRPKR